MTLHRLFTKCINASYIHVENAGDYFAERNGSTLYIYLQDSDGVTDWENNLDFPAKPYSREGDVPWFVHRGFLRVWQSVEKYIGAYIKDTSIKKIVTVGYSHGAALAVLCHEYVWYNRPELREVIEGYGFGCPRVLWGVPTNELIKRWSSFTVIRNIDDIVTHAPPRLLGFFHVGKMLEIGEKGKYSPIDAHRPENISRELLAKF